MTRAELKEHISRCLDRLEKDGHSEEVMDTNRWVTGHFAQYCDDNQNDEIDFKAITEFLERKYAIDPFGKLCGSQISIRRPLLVLWEFSQTGNYLKSHLPELEKVPQIYSGLYQDFCGYVNSLALNVRTKSAKVRFAKYFLAYLAQKGVREISGMSREDVSQYINTRETMTYTTKQSVAYNLRQMINWLHGEGKLTFSGFDVFPQIRYPGRKFVSSCYSDGEVRRILSHVDTSTAVGKHDYLVLCLLVYYGLRSSDVIALCFSNIDWNAGAICITQQKTRKPLSLPLIDDVKLPLLDYLKNARPDVGVSNILITVKAPYTAYARNKSLQPIVVKYVDKAGIDYSNRHHGTHAMRYSLASSLLNANVPISAISGVLGHGSIVTTNHYLGIGEEALGELALEVPYVQDA